MKRKTISLLLALTIATFGMTACGNNSEQEISSEQTESVTETEQVETEQVETEQVETEQVETEQVSESTEVDTIITEATEYTALEEEAGAVEPSFAIVEQGDYPDNRSDHQQSWDVFCQYFNESDYGTTLKGKNQNTLPYGGPTGYDSRLLEERTTDKGYTVMYDTATGRVYYSGMVMPNGSVYGDCKSDTVVCQYLIDNDINTVYDLTYAQFQELLGVYNGN